MPQRNTLKDNLYLMNDMMSRAFHEAEDPEDRNLLGHVLQTISRDIALINQSQNPEDFHDNEKYIQKHQFEIHMQTLNATREDKAYLSNLCWYAMKEYENKPTEKMIEKMVSLGILRVLTNYAGACLRPTQITYNFFKI